MFVNSPCPSVVLLLALLSPLGKALVILSQRGPDQGPGYPALAHDGGVGQRMWQHPRGMANIYPGTQTRLVAASKPCGGLVNGNGPLLTL